MRRSLTGLALVAALIVAVLAWLRGRDAEIPEPVVPARTESVSTESARAVPTQAEPRTAAVPPRSADSPPDPPPGAQTSEAWTGIRVRTVSKETGAPLAGIPVSARATGSRSGIRSVAGSRGTGAEMPSTDESGYAEFVLQAGFTGTLHANGLAGVAGSGSREVDEPLAPGEVRTVEIALPTALDLVLHGRVVDRETNAPIPGARVGTSQGLGKIRADGEQLTAGDGRFRVAGASWNRHVVQVIAAGYEPAALRMGPGHEDPAAPLEIALSRVASVRITASAVDGAPLVGQRVVLSTAGYRFGRPDGMDLIRAGWIEDARYTAVTDAGGRAFLPELPPRMPFAGVLQEGRDEVFRAPEELVLEPGELREVAWRVGAGAAIHGLALEASGTPAAGLAIALQPARSPQPTHFQRSEAEGRRSAQTDAEGRFTFADVGPGDWWVGPAPLARNRRQPAANDDVAPAAQLVAVAPGAARVDVTLRVARGHTIRGRLVDPDGGAVRHAFVTIERATDRFHANENVNTTDGSFVLGPLEPGEYVLNARSIGEFVDPLPVTARTGDTDVVLQFQRGGGIAGLVLGADGKPAPRADVVLNPRVPGGWSQLSSAAGDDGRFSFDGLAAGLYDLAARTADGRIGLATAIEVVAGATRDAVRVETAPGARVRVRFTGPGAHVSVSVLAGGVTIHADGVEQGTERTFAAPAGACLVRATRYPERIETDLPLTLAAGETRDLVFDGVWK
ncbi:MAG: carboxypeptidase regulatory-like domain-containing protein [Planctomycetes bacterium]|nr:carboxypeptidase regulatory-like domain-containing protein [Planctomycetota bacterium]